MVRLHLSVCCVSAVTFESLGLETFGIQAHLQTTQLKSVYQCHWVSAKAIHRSKTNVNKHTLASKRGTLVAHQIEVVTYRCDEEKLPTQKNRKNDGHI